MSSARAHQIPGRPEDGDVGGKEKPARAGRPERDRHMELTVQEDLPHIVFRDRLRDGGLAQLGERLPCKQEVSGSNPLISTKMG